MDSQNQRANPDTTYRKCAYCGTEISKSSTRCPVCNRPQSSVNQSNLTSSLRPYVKRTNQYPRSFDNDGLQEICTGTAVLAVGLLFSVFGILYLLDRVYSSGLLNRSAADGFAALLFFGLFITLISSLILRQGYKELSKVYDDLSTPGSLTGAYSFFTMLFILLFLSTISSGSSSAFAFLVLIGFAVFVCYLGGILLGIWRTGTRIENQTVKLGAVLLIIPYVNVIGAVIAAVSLRKSLYSA